MTKIEIFKKMLDWLCANIESVNSQTDVARAAGLNETTVSRIMNGRVKNVKYKTLLAVNATYGNVFNPEWLRGESEVMLIEDIKQDAVSGGSAVGEKSVTPEALLASKDDTIAALREQLAAKDSIIKAKDDVITSKDALISTLQQQISELRSFLSVGRGAPVGHSQSEVAERKSNI